MKKHQYIHGYHEREALRLSDQAHTLNDLLHHDTVFPKDSLVLEAGCGTGAQTEVIAQKNSNCKFISIDISKASLKQAQKRINDLNIRNVQFRYGNIIQLEFPDASFDHVFVCFVLEHLASPAAALSELKRVLKTDGSITVIEGDHGSACFYPESTAAESAIKAQIRLQADADGNALIGRRLFPLLGAAGFKDCTVSPRLVYADASRPELVEGFTKNTFTAMIEGIREPALARGIIDKETFERGIKDLYLTAKQDGVFCYTFFKGTAYKKA